MLGYDIRVHGQSDGGYSPAQPNAVHGTRLAGWQVFAFRGLDWINALVEQGKVISSGGNGYPFWYTAIAKEVISFISDNPPFAKSPWVIPEGSVLVDNYLGETTIDKATIAECIADEWLVIEAWDES